MRVIRRIVAGAACGAAGCLVCLLVAALRAGAVVAFGARVSGNVRDAGLLAWYGAGFVAAGALLGALWPLRRRRPAGPYALGVVGACLVFAFIARSTEGPVARWTAGTYVMIAVLSGIMGTALGGQIAKEEAAAGPSAPEA